MTKRAKVILIATAVFLGGAAAIYFLITPPEPNFAFIGKLDGEKIGDQRKGRFEIFRTTWSIHFFYAFDEYPAQVQVAMKEEFAGKPGWVEYNDSSRYASQAQIVSIWPMNHRELPEGSRTVVCVARHPTWTEKQLRIIGSYFTGEKLPGER